MDPKNLGINGAGAENQPAGLPPQETKTASQEAAPSQNSAATGQGDGTAEKQQPSPRLQQRLAKLTQGKCQAEEELETIKAQANQNTGDGLPPWLAQVKSDPSWSDLSGDIDPEVLRQRVAKEAEAIAEAKLVAYEQKKEQERQETERQAKLRAQLDELHADFRQVEETHPRLNPDSDEYDEDYTRELAELYEEAAQNNPGLKLSTFVNKIEKLSGKEVAKQTASVAQVLASQAGEQALTGGEAPSGTNTAEDVDSQLYRQGLQTGDFTALIKHRVFGNKK